MTITAWITTCLFGAQLLYNALLGYWVWQWRRREQEWRQREVDRERADERREADLRETRRRCDVCRREVDDRCAAREKEAAAARASGAVLIERLSGKVGESFATREDVREMGQKISADLRRLFEGQDKVRQRLAALEARANP